MLICWISTPLSLQRGVDLAASMVRLTALEQAADDDVEALGLGEGLESRSRSGLGQGSYSARFLLKVWVSYGFLCHNLLALRQYSGRGDNLTCSSHPRSMTAPTSCPILWSLPLVTLLGIRILNTMLLCTVIDAQYIPSFRSRTLLDVLLAYHTWRSRPL